MTLITLSVTHGQNISRTNAQTKYKFQLCSLNKSQDYKVSPENNNWIWKRYWQTNGQKLLLFYLNNCQEIQVSSYGYRQTDGRTDINVSYRVSLLIKQKQNLNIFYENWCLFDWNNKVFAFKALPIGQKCIEQMGINYRNIY